MCGDVKCGMVCGRWEVGAAGVAASKEGRARVHAPDEVEEEAERGGHDGGVLVAERPADGPVQVRDGGGLQGVEALQGHDGLLAHGLLLRCCKLHTGDGESRGRSDITHRTRIHKEPIDPVYRYD